MHLRAFLRIAGLSMRNLVRQKRRSVLLGTAIAFGMMVLTLAHSFSHGLSETVFNRVMRFLTGHIEVVSLERGKKAPIIRDTERVIAAARTLPHFKYAHESIIIYTRLIGNGRADTSVIIGVEGSAERIDEAKSMDFYAVAGTIADFTNGRVPYPILIYEDKAKALNVRVGDTVKTRFQTVDGMQQSASFTVVAFIRAVGSYQSMASLALLPDLKRLMGYAPHESATLQLILTDPREAPKDAALLRKALVPNIARIDGAIGGRDITVLGIADGRTDRMAAYLSIDARRISGRGVIVLPRSFAEASSPVIRDGSQITLTYRKRHGEDVIADRYTVIVSGSSVPYAFMPGDDMVNACRSIPAVRPNAQPVTGVSVDDLVHEWRLLPGTKDDRSLRRKMRDAMKTRYSTLLDVRTMYEHDIGKYYADLERALYAITWIGVIVLFFIILVGVVNTLRMSIRERTREIGTMRALGMQAVDVQSLFIYEVLFLAFFASVAGALLALAAMPLISLISFETESAAAIILVNKHIGFSPVFFGGGGVFAMAVLGTAAAVVIVRVHDRRTALALLIACIGGGFIVSAMLGSIVVNGMLLLLIAVATAYMPAAKAAAMSASKALVHYE